MHDEAGDCFAPPRGDANFGRPRDHAASVVSPHSASARLTPRRIARPKEP